MGTAGDGLITSGHGFAGAAEESDTLCAMPGRELLLVGRREVDLLRVASAACPPITDLPADQPDPRSAVPREPRLTGP